MYCTEAEIQKISVSSDTFELNLGGALFGYELAAENIPHTVTVPLSLL